MKSFQSTLPMRGATNPLITLDWGNLISIHAPHAGSDVSDSSINQVDNISIHAPHAGSDASLSICSCKYTHFNPRSPCGERRCWRFARPLLCHFNPRSPCGERLCNGRQDFSHICDFNPRSPCGERQQMLQSLRRK